MMKGIEIADVVLTEMGKESRLQKRQRYNGTEKEFVPFSGKILQCFISNWKDLIYLEKVYQ